MKVFGPAKAAVTIRLGYLQARCNGLEEEEGNPGKQRFFDVSQLCSFCIRAPRLGFFSRKALHAFAPSSRLSKEEVPC